MVRGDGSPSIPGAPLRRGYVVQDRIGNAILRVTDGLLERVLARGPSPRRPIRRLLLSNGRHLGDVVISTSLLPLIKAALPEVEIGMLVGSWSRPVVEKHSMLSYVHSLDHWKLDRSTSSLDARLGRYRRTRRAALQQIRAVGYDAAVELLGFFPNAIPVLWQARIPVRVGYGTGGFGPMLTHNVVWSDSNRHIAEYQVDLLRVLGVPVVSDGALCPVLPAGPEAAIRSAREKVGGADASYVVVHMGSGLDLKEWPLERWTTVVAELARKGHRVVLTGQGERERENARVVVEAAPRVVDLVGELSWAEFVEVLRSAQVLICVDSVAGHVAAAEGVPTVVLMAGLTNPHHWRPLGERVWALTNAVPCAPCYRGGGCPGMECIRDIPEKRVLAAFELAMG